MLRTLALAGLLAVTSVNAHAQAIWPPVIVPDNSSTSRSEPAVLKPPSYFLMLRENSEKILTSPNRWSARTWQKAGICVGVIGLATLADAQVREESLRHRGGTTDQIANAVGPFGSEYSFGVLAVFYGAGRLFGNERAAAVAEDGLASSIIAGGLIAPALKSATGRSRPSQSDREFEIDRGGASFPSGHTTQAFAVASVVASHYDSVWVDSLAYGMASLVGLSRIYHEAHFASDVVAGAIIGIAVGRSVVRMNSAHRAIGFEPMITRSGDVGLSLRLNLTRLTRKLNAGRRRSAM